MGPEVMSSRIYEDTGAALIMVLISISLLLIMGSSFLNCTVKDFIISENLSNNTQARYYAESGIQLAYAVLSEDIIEYHEVIYITGTGAESCMEVWVEPVSEEDRLVTSTGYSGNAREKVNAVITMDGTGSGLYIRKWMKPD